MHGSKSETKEQQTMRHKNELNTNAKGCAIGAHSHQDNRILRQIEKLDRLEICKYLGKYALQYAQSFGFG